MTKLMGIDHRFVSSYHPQANGLAERMVDSTLALLSRTVPPSQVRLISIPDVLDDPTLTEPSFVVERILAHRGATGKRAYLVKWKGYPTSSNSWEPFSNFDDTDCIRLYWNSKRK
jgi:hypothetical protein